MNHQDIEQLFFRARTVRLSGEAKAAGRRALFERMQPTDTHQYVGAHFLWLKRSWLRSSAFASLFLLVGGTAWAAEGALPGDTLYTWKTGVNESVRLVLSPTPIARAEWSVELISRRLNEADRLVADGRLNKENQALLEDQLNEERQQADNCGQSENEGWCGEIETAIQQRLATAENVEVREDAGRLRIRVREEHEEKEGREEKQRENEVRHEDGWIEEAELHEDRQEDDGKDGEENQAVQSLKSDAEEKRSIKKATKSKTEESIDSTSNRAVADETPETKTSANDDEEDEAEDGSAEEETLVSESAARSKALAAVPGTVKGSEFKDDDDPVWEVEIQRSSDGKEVMVTVDARSGGIDEIEEK